MSRGLSGCSARTVCTCSHHVHVSIHINIDCINACLCRSTKRSGGEEVEKTDKVSFAPSRYSPCTRLWTSFFFSLCRTCPFSPLKRPPEHSSLRQDLERETKELSVMRLLYLSLTLFLRLSLVPACLWSLLVNLKLMLMKNTWKTSGQSMWGACGCVSMLQQGSRILPLPSLLVFPPPFRLLKVSKTKKIAYGQPTGRG